jgi:hypothetical protein
MRLGKIEMWLGIILLVCSIVGIFVVAVSYEEPQGEVVDRSHVPGHTQIVPAKIDPVTGRMTGPTTKYVSAKYTLTIRPWDTDDRVSITVGEAEYYTYQIGDSYPRKGAE